MMSINDIIRKYKLPRATRGVQVSPTLGIVDFTKGIVHKVYPDATVIYINNKIKIYSGQDTDIIVKDGYWILAIPVKQPSNKACINYSLVVVDEAGMESGVLDPFKTRSFI